MDSEYVSENLTAFPTGRGGVWQSHCITGDSKKSSVSPCSFCRGGRRCWKDCGQGSWEGLSLTSAPWLSSLPSLFLLYPRRSCFISVPPLSALGFMPPCFLSVPLNHPISCPRFLTFPNLVLFCFSLRVAVEARTEPHLWCSQTSLEITVHYVHPAVLLLQQAVITFNNAQIHRK